MFLELLSIYLRYAMEKHFGEGVKDYQGFFWEWSAWSHVKTRNKYNILYSIQFSSVYLYSAKSQQMSSQGTSMLAYSPIQAN